ncbi:MAG: CBS domain-containing protein [Bacteroidota bacterium]|nr:CBS domain-containing protein [Bacteroidota bacterium]
MQAKELISTSIVTIDPKHDGNLILSFMEELKILHLPVVDGDQYIGLISESEILAWDDTTELIQEHIYNLASPSVNEGQHLFEILKIMDENSLSLIPVVNENQEYIGGISDKKLLYKIAKSVSVQSIGSIIVLEMHEKDYNMSEISRIIESNNAKILSSYITSNSESTKLELTIKVNKLDIRDIISDLERFEYTLMASFSKKEDYPGLLDRFEGLMRFLNP